MSLITLPTNKEKRIKTNSSNRQDEIPNARTRRLLKKAEENRKKGKGSPIFDNAEDAIKWLKEQGV